MSRYIHLDAAISNRMHDGTIYGVVVRTYIRVSIIFCMGDKEVDASMRVSHETNHDRRVVLEN